MKPIYFPYTFVPIEIAEACADCFGQMVVYQPPGLDVTEQMADAKEKGLLDIRVPQGINKENVSSVVKDYKAWADIHKDGDLLKFASLGQQRGPAPFFSESSIMKIKEDLQRKIRNNDTAHEESNFLFSAMVFLHMAYEFDKQQHDIHSDIRQLDKMEYELMESLQRGKEDFDDNSIRKGTFIPNDAFDFMISERIEAWSGLLLHTKNQDAASGLFLTSHRPVFNYMIENFPEGEMILEGGDIPMDKHRIEEAQKRRDTLLETIETYTKEPWDGEIARALNISSEERSGNSISLSLYIVPGENPFDFFARFYPVKIDGSYQHYKTPEIINTLIGLLEV
jgi:hypothetical protein